MYKVFQVPFEEVVQVEGAAWLQIQFDECKLGNNSFISITSLQDGATQNLNAKALKNWENATAYFNGDKVLVKLNVAARDTNVSIKIKEVVAGEQGTIQSICGSTDDRIPSKDPASGRIVPVGCTG